MRREVPHTRVACVHHATQCPQERVQLLGGEAGVGKGVAGRACGEEGVELGAGNTDAPTFLQVTAAFLPVILA